MLFNIAGIICVWNVHIVFLLWLSDKFCQHGLLTCVAFVWHEDVWHYLHASIIYVVRWLRNDIYIQNDLPWVHITYIHCKTLYYEIRCISHDMMVSLKVATDRDTRQWIELQWFILLLSVRIYHGYPLDKIASIPIIHVVLMAVPGRAWVYRNTRHFVHRLSYVYICHGKHPNHNVMILVDIMTPYGTIDLGQYWFYGDGIEISFLWIIWSSKQMWS